MENNNSSRNIIIIVSIVILLILICCCSCIGLVLVANINGKKSPSSDYNDLTSLFNNDKSRVKDFSDKFLHDFKDKDIGDLYEQYKSKDSEAQDWFEMVSVEKYQDYDSYSIKSVESLQKDEYLVSGEMIINKSDYAFIIGVDKEGNSFAVSEFFISPQN